MSDSSTANSSTQQDPNGSVVPTVACGDVEQFTVITEETRIATCDFSGFGEMGFLLAGTAPSLVLALSTFGGYYVNISTPGPLSTSAPVLAKILVMNNNFDKLFSSLNFQVNLAPGSSIKVILNTFRWRDQDRISNPSSVYALPGSSYAAIMFAPISRMDGTSILLQTNSLKWLQAHGNESSFSFIQLSPSSVANACVIVVNCVVNLINEAALVNATWLYVMEMPPMPIPATQVTALGSYELPSYAPTHVNLTGAGPSTMTLFRLEVGEGTQLVVYGNIAQQNFLLFDTVGFRVSVADGALIVSENQVIANTFLDVSVSSPEALRDTVPFAVMNNTFGAVGGGELLIEEEMSQPGQTLFLASRGLPQSSNEYSFCGNAIKGKNFTTLIGSLQSLLHYSDWGGSFSPDSLRCGRAPTSASLEQCTAPMDLPLFNRNYLRDGRMGLNPSNEYYGELCGRDLPQNPVLVGDTTMTDCTLVGNTIEQAGFRHDRSEGVQIAFIVVKPIKFTVRRLSIYGFWFNVTTRGPLANYRDPSQRIKIDLEISNCKSIEAFLSFNMEGNWAPGSFFNFFSNSMQWWDDYHLLRQREGIQAGSMFAMFIFPPDSTCDGCGIRLHENVLTYESTIYEPIKDTTHVLQAYSWSMLQLVAYSMKDSCVTVTDTTFRFLFRCLCWYDSTNPVILDPLQSTPYEVPKFNLLGNERYRPIIVKVHTGSQVTIANSEYKDTSTTEHSYPLPDRNPMNGYLEPWSKLRDPIAFTISGDSGPFTFENMWVEKSTKMMQILNQYGRNIPNSEQCYHSQR